MSEPDIKNKKYIRPETDDLLQDFHTDLSVGDIIRRARVRLGLEIGQVATEIRIRENYLLAIEEGKLEELPGRVYALGFIRTYAEHLNLDGEKVIQLLKRQSGEKVEYKPLRSTLPVEGDYSLPALKTVAVVILMLIAGMTVYSFYLSSGQVEEQIPSVPQELREQVTLLSKPQPAQPVKKELLEKESDTDRNVETVAGISQAPEQTIVLQAIDQVWLEIKNEEGKTILSRVLSKGEEYWVPEDQSGLVMTLGNAGGLQIMVDGQKLPILGRKSKVIRNLPLNTGYLKEILKKSAKKSM